MRFIGLQYPLVKTSRGLLAQKTDIDQIKADLLQLLLTSPGERVMLPDFGTDLRRLVYEPNDAILEMDAKKLISSAVAKWEPRIEIKNINVSAVSPSLNHFDDGTEIDHILSIQIEFFDPGNINQVQELKLQIPLGNT